MWPQLRHFKTLVPSSSVVGTIIAPHFSQNSMKDSLLAAQFRFQLRIATTHISGFMVVIQHIVQGDFEMIEQQFHPLSFDWFWSQFVMLVQDCRLFLGW